MCLSSSRFAVLWAWMRRKLSEHWKTSLSLSNKKNTMAYQRITETDIAPLPHALRDLQLRYFGATSVSNDSANRFFGPQNPAPAMYAGLAETKDAPYKTLDGPESPFLVRAHTALWFLNKAEYDLHRSGKRTSDLQPWQPGDGPAYAFVTFAISQVHNGLARLLADLLDRLPQHPAYNDLDEIFWFTRSDKGAMITNYVEASPTGDNYQFNNPDGQSYSCPFYAMPWKEMLNGGKPDMQMVVSKLVGIERNFSRDVLNSQKPL